MPRFRRALPQLRGGRFLTDGGLETTLVFHDRIDLPLFARVRSAGVPNFRFRKASTQNSAEACGVKAVMMTAQKN